MNKRGGSPATVQARFALEVMEWVFGCDCDGHNALRESR